MVVLTMVSKNNFENVAKNIMREHKSGQLVWRLRLNFFLRCRKRPIWITQTITSADHNMNSLRTNDRKI